MANVRQHASTIGLVDMVVAGFVLRWLYSNTDSQHSGQFSCYCGLVHEAHIHIERTGYLAKVARVAKLCTHYAQVCVHTTRPCQTHHIVGTVRKGHTAGGKHLRATEQRTGLN